MTAAIRSISASGVHVVLATGRPPWRGVSALAAQLGLQGRQITLQGALLSDPASGVVDWARPMSPTLYRAAIWFADGSGLDPIVALIGGDRLERIPTEGVLFPPRTAIGRDPRYVAGLERLAHDGPLRVFLPTGLDRHLAVRRTAIERFDGLASVIWCDQTGVEILAPNTNKGEAVASLANSMGIGLAEVAAVGDAPNDTEMLRRVGRSAAMGSAPPEVQVCADIVVPSSQDLGVLDAFAWFFPDLAEGFAVDRRRPPVTPDRPISTSRTDPATS